MLLNVIKHQQPDIDKIFLYAKDLIESKHQLLFNGRQNKILKNPKHSLIIQKQ